MANLNLNNLYNDTGTRPKIADFSKLLKDIQTRARDSSTRNINNSITSQFDPKIASRLFSSAKQPPQEQDTGTFATGVPLAPQQKTRYEPVPDYTQFVPSEQGDPWSTPTDQTVVRNFPENLGAGQYYTDPSQRDALIKSERVLVNEQINPGIRKKILGKLPSGLFQVDHTVPLWIGGSDTMANLEVLDNTTHAKKTAIQAVPLTLLANGKINLNQAKSMAFSWRDKAIDDLPVVNERGYVPLDVAERYRAKWEEDAQKLPPSSKYFKESFLKEMGGFGEGWLPDPIREFVKGALGGVTAHIVPGTEISEDSGAISKVTHLAGEIAGTVFGIGKLAKGLSFLAGPQARTLQGWKKAMTLTINAKKAAGVTTAGGIGVKEIVKDVKAAVDKGTFKATAKSLARSEILTKMAKTAGLLSLWGQIGLTGREAVNKDIEFEFQDHVKQFYTDVAFGALLGASNHQIRGFAQVGLGTATLSLMQGEDLVPALENAALMTALHTMGLKRGMVDPKMRITNNEAYRMSADVMSPYSKGTIPTIRQKAGAPETLVIPKETIVELRNEYKQRHPNDTRFDNMSETDSAMAIEIMARNARQDLKTNIKEGDGAVPQEKIKSELTRITVAENQLKNQTLDPTLRSQKELEDMYSMGEKLRPTMTSEDLRYKTNSTELLNNIPVEFPDIIYPNPEGIKFLTGPVPMTSYGGKIDLTAKGNVKDIRTNPQGHSKQGFIVKDPETISVMKLVSSEGIDVGNPNEALRAFGRTLGGENKPVGYSPRRRSFNEKENSLNDTFFEADSRIKGKIQKSTSPKNLQEVLAKDFSNISLDNKTAEVLFKNKNNLEQYSYEQFYDMLKPANGVVRYNEELNNSNLSREMEKHGIDVLITDISKIQPVARKKGEEYIVFEVTEQNWLRSIALSKKTPLTPEQQGVRNIVSKQEAGKVSDAIVNVKNSLPKTETPKTETPLIESITKPKTPQDALKTKVSPVIVEIREDKSLGRLAASDPSTNKIKIVENITTKKLLNYIKGDTKTPVSLQKKEIWDNILSPKEKKVISNFTDKQARDFLIEHEKSHLYNRDSINYPRKNSKLDLMNPKALQIEVRAIRDALKIGTTEPQAKILSDRVPTTREEFRQLEQVTHLAGRGTNVVAGDKVYTLNAKEGSFINFEIQSGTILRVQPKTQAILVNIDGVGKEWFNGSSINALRKVNIESKQPALSLGKGIVEPPKLKNEVVLKGGLERGELKDLKTKASKDAELNNKNREIKTKEDNRTLNEVKEDALSNINQQKFDLKKTNLGIVQKLVKQGKIELEEATPYLAKEKRYNELVQAARTRNLTIFEANPKKLSERDELSLLSKELRQMLQKKGVLPTPTVKKTDFKRDPAVIERNKNDLLDEALAKAESYMKDIKGSKQRESPEDYEANLKKVALGARSLITNNKLNLPGSEQRALVNDFNNKVESLALSKVDDAFEGTFDLKAREYSTKHHQYLGFDPSTGKETPIKVRFGDKPQKDYVNPDQVLAKKYGLALNKKGYLQMVENKQSGNQEPVLSNEFKKEMGIKEQNPFKYWSEVSKQIGSDIPINEFKKDLEANTSFKTKYSEDFMKGLSVLEETSGTFGVFGKTIKKILNKIIVEPQGEWIKGQMKKNPGKSFTFNSMMKPKSPYISKLFETVNPEGHYMSQPTERIIKQVEGVPYKDIQKLDKKTVATEEVAAEVREGRGKLSSKDILTENIDLKRGDLKGMSIKEDFQAEKIQDLTNFEIKFPSFLYKEITGKNPPKEAVIEDAFKFLKGFLADYNKDITPGGIIKKSPYITPKDWAKIKKEMLELPEGKKEVKKDGAGGPYDGQGGLISDKLSGAWKNIKKTFTGDVLNYERGVDAKPIAVETFKEPTPTYPTTPPIDPPKNTPFTFKNPLKRSPRWDNIVRYQKNPTPEQKPVPEPKFVHPSALAPEYEELFINEAKKAGLTPTLFATTLKREQGATTTPEQVKLHGGVDPTDRGIMQVNKINEPLIKKRFMEEFGREYNPYNTEDSIIAARMVYQENRRIINQMRKNKTYTGPFTDQDILDSYNLGVLGVIKAKKGYAEHLQRLERYREAGL